MDRLVQKMDGQPGDLLLFAADRFKTAVEVLGALRLNLAKELELLRSPPGSRSCGWWISRSLSGPTSRTGISPCINPFTMPYEEDLPMLLTDPGKVRAKGLRHRAQRL